MVPLDSTRIVKQARLRQTLAQIWRITRAFFSSERRRQARGLSLLLLVLSVASTGITVLASYKLSAVMTAITARSHGYGHAVWMWLGSLALAVLCDVYSRWAQDSLGLLWREWMSQHLIKRYFNNRAYYRLRGSTNIDNPDQRISEDVKNFTTDSLSYVLLALSAVLDLIGFLGVLYFISGWLVLLALVYAVAGTWLCVRIGRRLVGMHYDKYQKEANFRYGLVRVRDNAECIAFYRGEKREHLDLVRRLASLTGTLRAIITWNRSLGFFRNSFDRLALLLPLLVVAPMFTSGRITKFGDVTQALEAFARVLGAVTLVSTNFEGLSSYLAGLQRLTSLWEDLDDFDADEQRIAAEGGQQLDETSSCVKLEALNVITPTSRKTLVRGLSFELHPRQSLLIMGSSGSGKSSVLRTIAGLWPSGHGFMERPALNHLMFLPQRPYMVPGSLRDQLHYPYPDRQMDEAQMLAVMERARLMDVLQRVEGNFDIVIDWSNVLSLGEQQRVAFARVFLREPAFVFLDEASSALDEANQDHLYQLIRASKSGFISVGHRSTLVKHHDRVLTMQPGGTWVMEASDSMGMWPD